MAFDLNFYMEDLKVRLDWLSRVASKTHTMINHLSMPPCLK